MFKSSESDKERGKKHRAEKVLKKMAENFSNLAKDINLQIPG